MTISTGRKLPDVTLVKAGPRAGAGPVGDYFKGKGRAVLGPGRLHPDLLGQAPAGLCREGARAQGQGRRRDRLHRRSTTPS